MSYGVSRNNYFPVMERYSFFVVLTKRETRLLFEPIVPRLRVGTANYTQKMANGAKITFLSSFCDII